YHDSRGDTRAAVGTDGFADDDTRIDAEVGQHVGERVVIEKCAVGGQDRRAWDIPGPRNVTGNRVDGFHLAAEAFGRASIEQAHPATAGLLRCEGKPTSGIQIIVRHSDIAGLRGDGTSLEVTF